MNVPANISYGSEQYLEAHYSNDPLWQRIEALSLDDRDAVFPFSAKLAKENGWTPRFARRAIEEYKRFVYLCCIGPQGASPSPVVDEVWHLHLTYTQHYWETLCEEAIGRKLHHYPSKGGAGETARHHDWYADTLSLYREVFGTLPDTEFWPAVPRSIPGKNVFRWPFGKAGTLLSAMLAIGVILPISGCGEAGFMAVLMMIGLFVIVMASILASGASDNAYGSRSGDKNKSSEGGGGGCGSGGCGSGGGCGGGGCGGGCGGCGG